jgi:uncharacterized LabA/DUF88 family protein
MSGLRFGRTMFFIDGENLVFRYQDMLENGYEPLNGIKHENNVYVWHGDIMHGVIADIVRISYYTSAVGDENKILALSEDIHKIKYNYTGIRYKPGGSGNQYSGLGHPEQLCGFLNPRLFKKRTQKEKAKAVDVNFTIDMLIHTANDNLDSVVLISGDGDFVPLVKTVMQRGKQVFVMALSKGLNKDLPIIADEFHYLDDRLFKLAVEQKEKIL